MKKIVHIILDKIRAEKENPETDLMIIESHLSSLSDTVNALMHDAEHEFLELYEKFQALEAQTVELTEMITRTTELACGREKEIRLAGLNEFANESMEKLQSFQKDITDSLRILDSGWTHLEKLSDLCTQAGSLAHFLNEMHSKENLNETPREIISFHDTVRQQINHVRQISLEFHKKALNAMLNASQFCHMGNTLERFAKEFTCSAKDENSFITRIRALADRLRTPDKPSRNEERAELPQDSQPAENPGTLFAANTSAASNMAQKLETAIANTRFALSFIPDFSNRMALLLKQSDGVCPLNPKHKKT